MAGWDMFGNDRREAGGGRHPSRLTDRPSPYALRLSFSRSALPRHVLDCLPRPPGPRYLAATVTTAHE